LCIQDEPVDEDVDNSTVHPTFVLNQSSRTNQDDVDDVTNSCRYFNDSSFGATNLAPFNHNTSTSLLDNSGVFVSTIKYTFWNIKLNLFLDFFIGIWKINIQFNGCFKFRWTKVPDESYCNYRRVHQCKWWR